MAGELSTFCAGKSSFRTIYIRKIQMLTVSKPSPGISKRVHPIDFSNQGMSYISMSLNLIGMLSVSIRANPGTIPARGVMNPNSTLTQQMCGINNPIPYPLSISVAN
jgi:hypothetical protein